MQGTKERFITANAAYQRTEYQIMQTRMQFISKRDALLIFTLARAAERTVDHSLRQWHHLRVSYSEEIKHWQSYWQASIAHHADPGFERSRVRHRMEQRLTSPYFLLWRLRHIVQIARGKYAFDDTELKFMASALDTFFKLSNTDEVSLRDDLLPLRRDLYLSELVILARCGNRQEFEKARQVEHFNMPTFRRYYSLDEIVGG